MSHRFALILCLGLSACADFPDLDGATPPVTGPAPRILPLDQVLAGQARPPQQADAASLTARAAALRARAAALRAAPLTAN